MVTIHEFRKMALSFSDVSGQPHFGKISLRTGKKIFATLLEGENRACLKLTPADQDVFSLYSTDVFYPVPNKWGSMGWTFVDLLRVKKGILRDALNQSYHHIAGRKGKGTTI